MSRDSYVSTGLYRLYIYTNIYVCVYVYIQISCLSQSYLPSIYNIIYCLNHVILANKVYYYNIILIFNYTIVCQSLVIFVLSLDHNIQDGCGILLLHR